MTPIGRIGYIVASNAVKACCKLDTNRCEKASARTPSAKLLSLLKTVEVPGGFEIGKIAGQGKWLVVEDVRNHRLLRFRVE